MQAVSVLPLSSNFRDSSDEFAEVSGKFEHDLMAKLKINDDENVKNEDKENHDEVEEDEEDEEEEEFSFVFANPEGSPISADDAFDNGQIRPVFPVFNQDLLLTDDFDGAADLGLPFKKVFVQQPDNSQSWTAAESSESQLGAPEWSYCEWSSKKAVKSNSTGLSKLWRFRDLKLRSSSDGKDTFVFLNPPAAVAKAEKSEKARSNVLVKKVKVVKGKTVSSAHEKHYVMNRASKENAKHKSYLPYRQNLFGFFTNANGLTRNVHPY